MEYKHEIVKRICVIGEPHSQEWTKELNLVRRNDGPAKYEIREWSPDHMRSYQGTNFTEAELKSLGEQLTKLFK